ncbi:2,3,4,5-tetrahydropyridine-2,6-dicarboxylate N-acetyltransferase [Dethiothermospora halolimnae]|uniref:2,3,4,5-tetrahydropyridine-2,6-dicarboxylate N-acetyltransferase n=1 Tax=Dethiothermospora halolimnae TaxID=3114390 RepID=UPI003CCBD6BA
MNNDINNNNYNNIELSDPYKLANFIKNSNKSTPVKLYVKGDFENIKIDNLKSYGFYDFRIIIGEYKDINYVLKEYSSYIDYYDIEIDRKNSAIPLLNIENIEARIEPGSIIRDKVSIGKNAVIMMGAVINIGSNIGKNTMVDMNAVIGARAIIGENCHVGAGAVVAGVLEPPSKTPVIIEDNVLIGANAVLLEGVRVKKGAVVAAGSIVTKDVPENSVVAGIPAKVIKKKDAKTIDKVKILNELRE